MSDTCFIQNGDPSAPCHRFKANAKKSSKHRKYLNKQSNVLASLKKEGSFGRLMTIQKKPVVWNEISFFEQMAVSCYKKDI
ncbi:MAG: hypothetical protein OXH57_03310 [Ekhidna sp.]|nr:hypothetical protein [Ekhidna sp.]